MESDCICGSLTTATGQVTNTQRLFPPFLSYVVVVGLEKRNIASECLEYLVNHVIFSSLRKQTH